jgi:hypothetical protein
MSIFRFDPSSLAKMDDDLPFGMDHFPSENSSLVLGAIHRQQLRVHEKRPPEEREVFHSSILPK